MTSNMYPFHYSITETFCFPNNVRKNWFLLSKHTKMGNNDDLVLKYYRIMYKTLFSSLLSKYTSLLPLISVDVRRQAMRELIL